MLSVTVECAFPIRAWLEVCCFCIRLEEGLMVANSLFSSRRLLHCRVHLPPSCLGTGTAAPTRLLLQGARGVQPLEGSQSQYKVLLLSSCCHFRSAKSQRLPPAVMAGLLFAPSPQTLGMCSLLNLLCNTSQRRDLEIWYC